MKRLILFPLFLFLTFLISYMNAESQKSLGTFYKSNAPKGRMINKTLINAVSTDQKICCGNSADNMAR